MPKLHVLAEGDSMSRRFTSILSASVSPPLSSCGLSMSFSYDPKFIATSMQTPRSSNLLISLLLHPCLLKNCVFFDPSFAFMIQLLTPASEAGFGMSPAQQVQSNKSDYLFVSEGGSLSMVPAPWIGMIYLQVYRC